MSLGEAAKAESGDYTKPPAVLEERRLRALSYFRQACKLRDGKGCALAAEAYASHPACLAAYALRACDLGELESCAAAANQLYFGRAIAKDLARAASLLKRACDGGVLGACDTLGSMMAKGEGAPADVKQGLALRHKACDGGEANSCYGLGTSYRFGTDGTPKNPEKAARAYQHACEVSLGSTNPSAASILVLRNCDPYAALLVEGRYFPKNEVLAARIWEPACAQGAFETCFPLARLVAAGRGVAKDPARAAELIEMACGNAFGAGCMEGAAMFRAGNGVPRDLARAASLEEKGAEWMASGCYMHGACSGVVSYYQKRGSPPRDPAVALTRIERACALGSPAACRLAAQKHAQGVWVKKDAQRAATLEERAGALSDPARVKPMLERGCADNKSEDCYLLGSAYLNGNQAWKIPKDEARARELLSKGCAASGEDMGVECRLAGPVEPPARELGPSACPHMD